MAALLLQGWPWLDRHKGPPPVYPQILLTARQLQQMPTRDRPQIVDARNAAAYRSAHLPGALWLDARALPHDAASLGPTLGRAGINARQAVVVYSDRRDPAAADHLLWRLELAGHREVRLLNGGLEAWRSAGFPVATGLPAPVAPVRFEATADTTRVADRAYVRGHYGRRGFTVIDWRPHAAWESGHIPHSLPLFESQSVPADGLYLDGAEARSQLATLGPRSAETIDLNDELIVCADDSAGQTPMTPYLLARLSGIPRVRVYPGGYSDWTRDHDLPVVRIVPVEELRRMLLDFRDPPVFLDLRGDVDYTSGHIPGARLLRPDLFEARLDSLVRAAWPRAVPSRTPLIVYCYGPTCTRSRNCTTMAALRGWRHLYWYRDGPLGWRQAGGELVRGDRP